MIHEVLFYLWNCPGALFTDTGEEEWFSTLELEGFLHPGERQILQKIMTVGRSYHQIEEFIALIRDEQLNINKGNTDHQEKHVALQPGLYIKAFCNGVDEVLEDYRSEIVALEEQFLKNSQLTLTFVLGRIQKYTTLLEAIQSMIQTIKGGQVHGCLFMGRLHKYINCGIESVSEAANMIIKSMNTIFYRDLCNWIIYGDLVDMYDEFFIADAKCADENFLYPEQLNQSIIGSSTICEAFKKSKIKKPSVIRKFHIRFEMLPSNISLETAETILFMGRIVWIVRNDPKQSPDDKYQLKFKRDVWEGKDVEYCRKIQAMENVSFNVAEFNKIIEECRLKLTKYLWTVMVDEAKLLEHLQLIRDYYALGRGELFQQFIVAAEDHLKETPTEYIITNLQFIFVETARKMYSDNDQTYLRFELALSHAQEKDSSFNPWARLEINFDIQWPLHIIFHPKSMSLYNKLFCFLLRVKKTHIDLHKLWLLHMEGKHKIDKGVWTLRNNLMFIVNNLQYYLQVDVIEAEFSILKQSVKNANEFEDIIRLHSVFLSRLLNKTFVMDLDEHENSQIQHKHKLYQLPALNYEGGNMVYRIFLQILQLCDEFCMVASMWQPELLELERMKLIELTNCSNDLVEVLLRVLNSLHENTAGHHLLQLLHRLDFNGWFTRNKKDSPLTQTSALLQST